MPIAIVCGELPANCELCATNVYKDYTSTVIVKQREGTDNSYNAVIGIKQPLIVYSTGVYLLITPDSRLYVDRLDPSNAWVFIYNVSYAAMTYTDLEEAIAAFMQYKLEKG